MCMCTRSTDYYLCLFMQTQFQLGSYIHACTNEMHSVANPQDSIPTLPAIITVNTKCSDIKAVPIYFINRKCHIKKLKGKALNLFNHSHRVYIISYHATGY